MDERASRKSFAPLWITTILVSVWSVLGNFWPAAAEYYPIYRPDDRTAALWAAFFIAVAAGILAVVVAPLVRVGVWGSTHRRSVAWTALATSITGLLAASVVLSIALSR